MMPEMITAYKVVKKRASDGEVFDYCNIVKIPAVHNVNAKDPGPNPSYERKGWAIGDPPEEMLEMNFDFWEHETSVLGGDDTGTVSTSNPVNVSHDSNLDSDEDDGEDSYE